MRIFSLFILIIIISSCRQYTKEELTGTWLSDNKVLQFNDSLVLIYDFPDDYRVYRYDITMNSLSMSLEDFTGDLAPIHNGFNIEELIGDTLVINGQKWSRVSNQIPIIYSSKANKYKVFYQTQLMEIPEIHPFPPPHSGEVIGLSCDQGLATNPIYRVKEAIRNQNYDSLISQIYYGTAADFVVASMAWQKLKEIGFIAPDSVVSDYIKSESFCDYYVFYCSVDQFEIASAKSILQSNHFIHSKIEEWLNKQIAILD